MCDVYKPRVEEGLAYMQGGPNAVGYSDFRKMYENKDIDGVVVATPDHWHALLTIMACAAGKDVYVEKPLTVFNDEGKWMIQAKNKYKRVSCAWARRGTTTRTTRSLRRPLRAVHWARSRWPIWAGSSRNLYPGFGRTPVEDPPADHRLRYVARPSPAQALSEPPRPLSLPLVHGLFRRTDDQQPCA